ncbi:SurA N-terminal domain-containing protein [Geomonas subterranea]|uniref:SurA N-terminal domain-containing protein n=1 Tax=Geomonas subterranea TaxID=2847989 RepID=A0ABX8LMU6_9BACT|nr:peptidylprolyl isomerase [Geomonas subterranea]QXE92251.1 SurA N-terminal domain-containing protein [Geomonas subterranea]QXM09649.1 SurA N-terminal domain-containing protein [Geomonas subterranea]
MLGVMRKYKQSIVIKVVFVVIVLSFIGTIFLVWGKGGSDGRGGKSYAATVNGTKISLDEFQKSYYRTRGLYEQIYGRTLTPELEKQMGIKKLTIDTLIDNVLILGEAKKMGIKVNKDEVAAEIAKIPAFQKNGAFDFGTYQQTLKANRITPKDFEESQEQEMLLQKARNKVKDGATVTDAEVKEAFKKQNDKVNLAYVSFSPADVKGSVKLTDQELTTYLQDHQNDFKTPEQVSVAYAVVNPAQLAAKVSVTPDEVQTYYQKNIDRYQGKGGILPFAEVKDKATADAQKQKAAKEAYEKAAEAVNKFKANGDIDGAAAALGAKVEKTPLFTGKAPAAGLAGETEVVARAFALKQGELGGPVETAKGIYLVKVLDKKPAAVPPLAQIKGAVEAKAVEVKAADLAKKKAEEALAQFAKGGVAAKETGSFGYAPTGAVPAIGTSPELMEAAFTLNAPNQAAKQPFKVGDRWYAVALKSRTEAPLTDLAKNSGSIKAALFPKKQQEALEKWVKGLRDKAKIDINPLVLQD